VGSHKTFKSIKIINFKLRYIFVLSGLFTVPQNKGITCSTWSLGDCKSLDYCCHLTHFCVLRTSLYNFEIKIRYVFRRLYIAECEMLFRKAQKMDFRLCHTLLQDTKWICTSKTLPPHAQVSESLATFCKHRQKLQIKLQYHVFLLWENHLARNYSYL
jgi:hypothetical protein